jgi:hypothetical protein
LLLPPSLFAASRSSFCSSICLTQSLLAFAGN